MESFSSRTLFKLPAPNNQKHDFMDYFGLDIGGANIKVASTAGVGFEYEFAFWKRKDDFVKTFDWKHNLFSNTTRVGITMTAELADCFASKEEGVAFIVDGIESQFSQHKPLYYQTNGQLATASVAKENWIKTAASNWHATASFQFSRSPKRDGFLVDIGSTTTDTIPVIDGQPVDAAQSDLDRLQNGQLLYAGVGRTPLFALVSAVCHHDARTPLARELFATIDDAFVWLRDVPEDSHDTNSADGRPRTRAHAAQRIARSLCADVSELNEGLIDAVSQQSKSSLCDLVASNILRVISNHPSVPLAFCMTGGGSFLRDAVMSRVANMELSDSHNTKHPLQLTPTINPRTLELIPRELGLKNPQLAPAQAVALARQAVDKNIGPENA